MTEKANVGTFEQHVLIQEQDMTNQERTEKALQESEERYRSIIEDQTELICRFRPDYTLTFVNTAYCRFFKREKEELIGHSFMTLIPGGDQKKAKDQIASLSKERPVSTHEHQVFLPNGKIGFQQWTNRVILSETGDIEEFQAVGRDITDRKRVEEALKKANDDLERLVENRTARLLKRNKLLLKEIEERKKTEEALRASEDKYRSVVDHIGIGVSLISPDMEIVTLNNQMKKWFPDIDVSTKPLCYEAFNNPPRETVCSYCLTIKTLQDGQVHESITETPAGNEIRHFRVISSPIKDKKGKLLSAIEMVDDITEWMKVQEKLRESEANYRTIFETTGTATMIIEEDNTVSLVNTEFEKQYGFSKEEIEGRKSWMEFICEDDLERMKRYRHLRMIDPDAAPRNYETRFVDSHGRVRDVFATISMIPGTKKSVASLLDITDRKQAEEAVKKRERELEMKSRNLEELNTALRVLLKRREDDKRDLEERVLVNIKQLVLPCIEKMRMSRLEEKDMSYVAILESNLKDIVSPFSQRLSSKYLNLTPKEIQVANLIRDGRTTKEIAELLNASPGTIDFHRNNIRHKLDMKNKKANLRTYLLTVS